VWEAFKPAMEYYALRQVKADVAPLHEVVPDARY